ncbi:pyruvate kinase-like [Aricia agestis]|uniref:pyruvate kinase-like n=1 Tax=Aricia agestis TaxID=91739 RepID=UPI001C2023AA|nr:pyruvate kinase-like [Aricia agestis]
MHQLVDTDLSDPNVFFTTPNKSRRCPVMVTIGDYNETSVDLQQLLEAGMNIAKLKIAETSTEERSFILERLKKATQICCRKYDVQYWPVATCVALKNSMVKTGLLESEEEYIEIKEDSEIILTNEDKYYDKCNEKKIYVNNPFLTIDTNIGGFLSNVCDFCTRVENHSRPFITQKDWDIVDFAIEYEIDMIILNYVTNREVVKEVKKYVKDKKRPMILSGIATMKGLKNIDDIMKESDGIVLSREFLPYEVSATYRYRLPYIQKWLAAKCFQVGKPLFICGGVFEEALRFGKFRYPQTTDVCNAILDGISGFILKSCAPSTTLTVKVLKSINEISCFVEPLITSSSHFMRIIKEVKVPVNAAEAAVIACVMAARQTNSRVIILPTVSGATVRILNWIRPPCLVIAISSDVRTTRRLHIYRGVTPLLFSSKYLLDSFQFM